jgi:hypothetical protein
MSRVLNCFDVVIIAILMLISIVFVVVVVADKQQPLPRQGLQ